MAGYDWPRETPHLPILQIAPSLLFICITFTNSNSYKYPLSFPLSSFYFSFFFLASCSQQRSHQENSSPFLWPSTPLPYSSSTSNKQQHPQTPPPFPLHHLVRTGHSFWIGVVFLLRRQDLGSVPSFWIGTELPFVGRIKDLVRRVISLSACLRILLTMRVHSLAKNLINSYLHIIRSQLLKLFLPTVSQY